MKHPRYCGVNVEQIYTEKSWDETPPLLRDKLFLLESVSSEIPLHMRDKHFNNKLW